jgi:hypothetical protein
VVGHRARVDHLVGTELLDGATMVRASDRRHHRGAGNPAELDRCGADTACRPGDEEPLAHREFRLAEQGVVGGAERLGEPSGLRPGHRLRHAERVGFVDHRQLRLTPATEQAHDPVPRCELPDLAAHRHHFPCHLEAGDVGRGTGRGRVAAPPLTHVSPVQPGCVDRDE